MQVTLTAMGGGGFDTLTKEGLDVLRQATCLIGAQRLLQNLPDFCAPCRVAATRPGDIMCAIEENGDKTCAVLFSGDTGFYSGARALIPQLEAKNIPYRLLPGLSSVQLLAAAIHRPWQDWLLFSAHGTAANAVGAVMQGKPAFFLTGGRESAASLCGQLVQAGLGTLPVTVGENLSYPSQRIWQGTAEYGAGKEFAPLSVLLLEPAPHVMHHTPGFPDAFFVRGNVPMTKREVRAGILSILAPEKDEILWDIGAGTGSVSVEMALQASMGRTYAVECNEEALTLIQQNREKLGAWNLHMVKGKAPEKLATLETPDAVFIGGSKGNMEPILSLIRTKNPKARLCISAICIETLYQAVRALEENGWQAEVTQISVSRSRPAGSLHLMAAQNPVFLIAGVPV